MLERVARAVDSRPFAVPEREDAILRRIGDARQHLRSPDRGRREIFVDARLEQHIHALEQILRAPQFLVVATEWRPAVSRDKPAGIEAGTRVALLLQHWQTHERMRARDRKSTRLNSSH